MRLPDAGHTSGWPSDSDTTSCRLESMRADLRRAIALLVVTAAALLAEPDFGQALAGGTLLAGVVATLLAWCAAARVAEAAPRATPPLLAGLAIAVVVLPALVAGPATFVILAFALPMAPFLLFWALIWFAAGLSAYKRIPQVPQLVVTAAGVVCSL